MIDYKKIGFKCGIEIHQQLDTKHKLFCKCGTDFSGSEPKQIVIRKMRAVTGELGEVDRTALYEMLKEKEFHYFVYPKGNCLVELDEEPPHEINSEALETALKISLMLNCEIPQEIHVMRKIIIDGSNISGFQRTALVGINGNLKINNQKIGIKNVCLEEESAQIIEKGENIIYGLDRLGIPLVEIGTEPDIKTPEQAKEVALKIGMILRSTGNVKRGLGTIRQDINVSINGGARVEIKGVQNLGIIQKIIENEVLRQKNLIEIKKRLEKIRFHMKNIEIQDVTPVFKDSTSNIVEKNDVFAMKIPGFAGLFKTQLTPTRTLGNEIANYVKAKSNAKGIIHSDEDISKYGFVKEFEILRSKLKADEKDLIVIVAGDKKTCKNALDCVSERVDMLLYGVPEETRRALENGDTEYMRPLPGAGRMYPETDVPPIVIDKNLVKRLKKKLPELIEDKITRFVEEYDLSDELAEQIVHSKMLTTFEKAAELGIDPKIAAVTLTSTLKELKRKENLPIEKISEEKLLKIFKAVKNGKIVKDSIPVVIKEVVTNPEEDLENIIKNIGAGIISDEELRILIRKEINENKQLLENPRGENILMGIIMRKVRGKVEGWKVMEFLKEEIKCLKSKK
jgi:glutamyl-tRNA(Gln) amidotransferase subunit E